MTKEIVKKIATHINNKQFKYLCSSCSEFSYKNGKVRKNPKLIYHIHGSEGFLENRVENRSSHHAGEGEIEIYINDSTIRE